MTYHFATTPAGAIEDLSIYIPTTISTLFSRLIGAVAVSIEAERDIEHVNVFDLAIDHWLRDAELARDAVTDVLIELKTARVARAEDEPLMVMASIVDALMQSETVGDFLDAKKRVREARFSLRCHGIGATSRRITQMLEQCHAHLTAMAEMDTYQLDYNPDDLLDGLQHAWPEAS